HDGDEREPGQRKTDQSNEWRSGHRGHTHRKTRFGNCGKLNKWIAQQRNPMPDTSPNTNANSAASKAPSPSIGWSILSGRPLIFRVRGPRNKSSKRPPREDALRFICLSALGRAGVKGTDVPWLNLHHSTINFPI